MDGVSAPEERAAVDQHVPDIQGVIEQDDGNQGGQPPRKRHPVQQPPSTAHVESGHPADDRAFGDLQRDGAQPAMTRLRPVRGNSPSTGLRKLRRRSSQLNIAVVSTTRPAEDHNGSRAMLEVVPTGRSE